MIYNLYAPIAEIACGTDGFGTLCQILKDTELYEALGGSEMLTAFAPTDDAFASLEGAGDLSIEEVTYIALGHVTVGSIKAEDLPCIAGENLLEMLNGKDTRTKCKDNADRVAIPTYQKGAGNSADDEPMIVTADIVACNGIVHIVDHVIIPNMSEDADESMASEVIPEDGVMTGAGTFSVTKPPPGDNVCQGTDPKLAVIDCASIFEDSTDISARQAQAGGDITDGYVGGLDVGDQEPITIPYYQAGLCPVNVHWHLGTEHRSEGEFDCEEGCGPTDIHSRRTLAGKVDMGFQCNLYDDEDVKFTKEYDWKYCKDMEVGQTYEVHWPHSTAGACGTIDQYVTPFTDGVLCKPDQLIPDTPLNKNIGVQGQVFVVVNDEDYYYPDLMGGMIIDEAAGYGADIAKYTGSSSGQKNNNDDACSAYAPITWQVDRKCNLISASAFDHLCAEMLSQRSDMSADTYPLGSRQIVSDELTANNLQRKMLRQN